MTPLEAKKFIKITIEEWKFLVTTYGYRFNWTVYDHGGQMPPGHRDESIPACTLSTPNYLLGDIAFNAATCAGLSNDELEEVVVHEIVHILLSPLERDAPDMDLERTVTATARLFIRIRDLQCPNPKVHKKK